MAVGVILGQTVNETIHVVSEKVIPNGFNDSPHLKVRIWSNGYKEYVPGRIFFGSKGDKPIPDVKECAHRIMKNGFDGIIPIQIGDGAIAPKTYCMGEIITNGIDRCSINIYFGPTLYIGKWVGDEWSGWYQYSASATVQ